MTRIKRTMIAVAAVAATAITGPAVAQAGTGQSLDADVNSGPVKMQLSAQRGADAPATSATGTMHGAVRVGSSEPVTADGSITCFDKQGDKMGMFVQFTGTKPAIMGTAVKGMFIHLDTDGNGQARAMTYTMTPNDSTSDCSPKAAVMPTSGNVQATG